MPHRQSAQIRQIDFSDAFNALTGQTPFPWQQSLYERFVTESDRNVPASCNLPTGMGKTSVIAIWLIKLLGGESSDR
jgi:CRISPR-associated endonuclease/helicase Cas3